MSTEADEMVDAAALAVSELRLLPYMRFQALERVASAAGRLMRLGPSAPGRGRATNALAQALADLDATGVGREGR
ncbi:MAG TPA: hypothetical protein VEA99_10385 [Gemmatimonadaceae bacterium]|nr:hypothetical protein [Gemmatimonadaceae bacterium]